MAVDSIKFYRGLKAKYNITDHGYGIYFATDTAEIIHNGTSYGFADVDLNGYATEEFVRSAVKGLVKSGSYDYETNTFTFLDSLNDQSFTIEIPISDTDKNGLMSKEDKKKLDSIQPGAQVNEIDDVSTDLGEFKILEKVATLKIATQINELIDSKVSSAYRYKGSVDTYEELPENAQVGDVYNVVAKHDNYPAGTNYAWTGDNWDALGGSVDTSDITNSLEDLTNRVEASEGKITTMEGNISDLQDTDTSILKRFTDNNTVEGSVRNLALSEAEDLLVWNDIN